ncbi:MAG: flagellar basal body P-ring formation chaperone FlgA [Opitutales bacterium]
MKAFGIWIFATLTAASVLPATAWRDNWGALLEPEASADAIAAIATPESIEALVRDFQGGATPPAAARNEPATPAAPASFDLTPDDLLHGLRAGLMAHFGVAEGELQVIPLHPLTKKQVPHEGWSVELVPPFPAALTARMHLRYRLTDGATMREPETVSVRLEWWREAFLARRLVRSGDALTADAFAIEPVDWLQHRGDLVSTSTRLEGVRLKGTWRPDEPLRWAIAEVKPLIENGAVIEVVAQRGALRVSMRGVATAHGNAGDLITVRNLQSRKEIQGIVSDENTVLVLF